ncbi:MAG: hypothetical protein ABI599_18525 [Flavobacteriales bacterium]
MFLALPWLEEVLGKKVNSGRQGYLAHASPAFPNRYALAAPA